MPVTLRSAALLAALVCCVSAPVVSAAPRATYAVEEKSIAQLEADLAAGRVTSVQLVKAYRARIARIDGTLRSVLALNPAALDQAAASDAARRRGGRMGPLAGVPVVLKDNIETADPVPTTAGSLALKDNLSGRDAPLAARLRAAGAIILGKTNLSEWANYRSEHSISGWSAVGGQTRNPYALDRNACGSSSGSGAAGAASLAAAAVGTETDGSVTCPAAINGLVGLKPTVGLIPRTHIVPISHTQDTAGPMTRSVRDAALMLAVMAGSDPADPASAAADGHRADYLAALRPDALRGVRIGVMRYASDFHPETSAVFARALAVLKAQGAVLVEIDRFPNDVDIGAREGVILKTELKADLGAYLATTSPVRVPSRTLADLIAFNRAHPPETALFGQELFEQSQATKGLDDPAYLKARAEAHQAAGPDGIDAMLKAANVTALVAPTLGPAWLIDPVLKDRFVGGGAGGPAAQAGYPHLTVPMGLVDGLPVGLSFVGPAWSEARLLGYGFAYEQASHARRPPTYARTTALDPAAVAAEAARP